MHPEPYVTPEAYESPKVANRTYVGPNEQSWSVVGAKLTHEEVDVWQWTCAVYRHRDA